MEKPKDITAIKLKDSDDKFKDIEFLGCDLTYLQYGYEIYNNIDVFSGNDSKFASGKIFNINNYEFDHNIDTYAGSSGCPIILNNNNNNLLLVIGIHKNGNKNIKINGGTFIGELINEINKDFNNNIRNIIIAEIFIKDEDVYNNISIINSYEKWIRIHLLDDTIKEEYKNEKEIKECEIKINDELIPFNYFHKFKKKGLNIIKYKFKNYLTSTNYMFYGCSSLTNINLSNFNTQNVTNMGWMFFGCSSLTNINLSNFNTQNVTDMKSMFSGCSSLTNINLSNFNTQNVTNMESMFYYCSSLTNINLSNFNTLNVTNMEDMFYYCSSLTNINLSNFNTQNVTNMKSMFSRCSSLTNINLSNFNTLNVTNMESMFYGCSSLKNVITKDNGIIKLLNNIQ